MFLRFLFLKINRPRNKEELFNLRHASLWNVVEHIFGVLKRRFQILQIAPEYNINIQARIPAALCAIHNFIRRHDPNEGPLPESRESSDNDRNNQCEADHLAEAGEEQGTEASIRHDRIAQQMWDDYQQILADRQEELELDHDELDDNDNIFS